ncbi:DUF58 domain-containing protein [Desulfonema ishimotonii]|uniref:DUF58 domain-containing protein n=1 Tax=Desulfonema ishimotonii TaxID=45657 RepID=A0A401G1W4_9BACT|nr:DUF58 domain-containing protein [Desulfonema ishimotonii]GBC63173.1 DUF58 domain-containing protein [Desulfonema ishimotonii]
MTLRAGVSRLFRTARPVPLPCILDRKRIYILPTRHGVAFIIILLGMLVGSANYNNNLCFLLTFLLGSMTFVSILHTHRNLMGIRVESAAPQPVFAGETAEFRLRIHAADAERISVMFELAGGPRTCRNLGAEKAAPVSVRIPAPQRGVLQAGPLTIATCYPLGLFRAWSRLDLRLNCPVYPAPIRGPFESAEGDSPDQEDAGRRTVAGVDDFEGLKGYQPGDAIRHIFWKAWAKGQGLQIKSFVGQTGGTVLLDWHLLRDGDTERRLSRLCGMVLKAEDLGMAYGLKLPDRTVDMGKGAAHMHNCLRALALFGIRGHDR